MFTAIKQTFAFYGFPEYPLTDEQLAFCYDNNLDDGDIYTIGCDVNAGYEFSDCIQEVLESNKAAHNAI